MASLASSSFFICFPLLFLYADMSHSLVCTNQLFQNTKSFDTCIDLPYHNAHLHWTYNELNSSLSMAFVAPPPFPDGWVAWAINPVGSGMIGAQALIAFKQPDGSVAAKTYDIESYQGIKEGPLSINVSDTGAEYSGGKTIIFGTWELPESPESINQVWQVGSSVVDGKPSRHDLAQVNIASVGRLNLLQKVGSGGVVSQPAASPAEAGILTSHPAASPALAGILSSHPAASPALAGILGSHPAVPPAQAVILGSHPTASPSGAGILRSGDHTLASKSSSAGKALMRMMHIGVHGIMMVVVCVALF
ncbi:hypothetical protein Drorol1_Dr00007872 [Drosera rotundifolia]